MASSKAKKTAKAKKGTTAKSGKKKSTSAVKVAVKGANPHQKWVDFAKENKITKPYFVTSEGAVRRTEDGKPYSSPEELYADGGARDWSNVQQ